MPQRSWYLCTSCRSYVHSDRPGEPAWVCEVCSGTSLVAVPGEVAVEAIEAGERARSADRAMPLHEGEAH